MGAAYTFAALIVALGLAALFFLLGYKFGTDTKKPLRDSRGRFMKRPR